MRLKEVNLDETAIRPCSKQTKVREILNQFKRSNMKCAEIENWEEISDTLEGFRQIVKNQISYRNGRDYKNISIVTRTDDSGFKAYLVKKEEMSNGRHQMA